MDAVLLAAIVAGAATLIGYLLAQSWARRERKAKSYAEARAAMRRYQEVPYRIWRRPSSDPAVRTAIGQELSDSISGVAFHQALLRIDCDVVGTAYWDLWSQVRVARKSNSNLAWRSPLLTSDDQMAENPPFADDEGAPELELCITAMRRELSLIGPLMRRQTRRKLKEQRERRTADRGENVVPPPSPKAWYGPSDGLDLGSSTGTSSQLLRSDELR